MVKAVKEKTACKFVICKVNCCQQQARLFSEKSDKFVTLGVLVPIECNQGSLQSSPSPGTGSQGQSPVALKTILSIGINAASARSDWLNAASARSDWLKYDGITVLPGL